MIKLNSLNESLEKLYPLNEAFGDTFPKWLKTGLANSRKHFGVNRLSVSPRHGYGTNSGAEPQKAETHPQDRPNAHLPAGTASPRHR